MVRRNYKSFVRDADETSLVPAENELVKLTSGDLAVGDGVTAVSSLSKVGSNTYVRSDEALPRWKAQLGNDPANARIALIGDSTSDEGTAAQYIVQRLRAEHCRPGGSLEGVPMDVLFDVTTTNGSPVIGSATGFLASDAGKYVGGIGTNIPVGTKILSVDPGLAQATMTANATATSTSRVVHISRHIVGLGKNGTTLRAWLDTPANMAELVAFDPHLIVPSFLLNDLRLGFCDYATARARLIELVTALRANVPSADILLRIPNPMLTANVSSLNYVRDSGGTINPAGAAQSYSTIIRKAYLSLVGMWPNVEIADVQSNVFGTTCLASHPLMSDQLHPAPSGSAIGPNPSGGGYVAIADYLATVIGFPQRSATFPSSKAYSWIRDCKVIGGGSGYIDLGGDDRADLGRLAGVTNSSGQYALGPNDVLFVDGWDGPISLAGKTPYRPHGGNIRITGLTGYDFSTSGGRRAVLAGNHAGETTGDRQIVSVDLPSIAAGATVTQSVTVAGAASGDLHYAATVVASPPAGFSTAGLLLIGCYPTGADTVRLVVNNPTGGAIDRAAENWAFWVVR